MPKKILVVDDEIEVLNILDKKLSQEGFIVVTAATGEEAIKQLEQEEPDLALLDIMLPDMDGSEVVKRLLANPRIKKPLPIIFLSGIITKDEENVSLVKVAGCGYPAIAKPISFNHLLEEINRSLPE